MLGKSKKKDTNENYVMKEKYHADKLVVANLQRISSLDTPFGPMIETTEQKYIFEIIECDKNIKYREIFTGFITECVDDTTKNGIDFKYFDLPYVYKPIRFTDYVPETIGMKLPKLSLIWAQNDINYAKNQEKHEVKIIRKKKTNTF